MSDMSEKRKCLIAGGNGLIGSHLADALKSDYEVRFLSRQPAGRPNFFSWDIDAQTYDPAAFKDIDLVVHLAGASVAGGRWTADYKKKIIESRLSTTRLIARALKDTGSVECAVSASAVGYYGNRGSEAVDELSEPGSGFLAETSLLWEEALAELSKAVKRNVILRIGVVLSKSGGALAEMARPFRFFAGAIPGSGENFIPWIHIDDVCGLIAHADKNGWNGVYNAVSPGIVRSREFYTALALTLKRPILLPRVPEALLRIALGEMADMALEGANVSSDKARNAGYRLRYANLRGALSNLIG